MQLLTLSAQSVNRRHPALLEFPRQCTSLQRGLVDNVLDVFSVDYKVKYCRETAEDRELERQRFVKLSSFSVEGCAAT